MNADRRQPGRNVAGALKTVCTSLAFRSAVCMIAYAAVLIGLFAYVGALVDEKLSEAFPTIETITVLEDALAQDRFNELAQAMPDNCDLLVYSGDGEVLFATSESATSRVRPDDLPVVAGSEENRSFFEVFKHETADGTALYEILLCAIDRESHAKTVRQSCICDEEGNILHGNLFAGRTKLSQRELELVSGMLDSRTTVEKHEYQTADGNARTLILIAPIISEQAYNDIVAQAGRMWLWAIPVALAATVVAVAVLARMVRRMTKPLDQAIDARKKQGSGPAPEQVMPLELRPTYENFMSLMDQLDSTREDRQRIIADISHDLKTPLTVISGYTQAFQDGRVPDEKRDEYLKAINERAHSATQLIDELFTFAKSEHPSFQPTFSPYDLNEQMRLLLIRWQPDIESAGNVLEADIPEEPLVIELDWELAGRAIDNLIGNACTHNPPGTVICVSCARTRNSAVISVADTGVGMPAALRRTAFDSFVTGSSARSTGEGTGLGLSIASSFIGLNGGTIRFADEPRSPYNTEAIVEFPIP